MTAEQSRLAKLRAAISLPVLRRVSGSLDGRHRAIWSGKGQDFSDLVEYNPGDNVSDIDWKTSARAGHPVIRRFQRESNLSLILAVDTGRTMGALAPSGETKEDVALHVVEILSYLSLIRGDQVGLIAGDSARLRQIPARNGNSHLETILRYLESDIHVGAPASNVTRLLQRLLTYTHRRSLIVLITDEVNPPPEAEIHLKRLVTQHEVIVVSVQDANPTDIEEGAVAVDVEQGPLPDFVLTDDKLRGQAHQIAAWRRDQTRQLLARTRVQYVSVSGKDSVIPALIDILGRHKRAYS